MTYRVVLLTLQVGIAARLLLMSGKPEIPAWIALAALYLIGLYGAVSQ